MKKQGIFELLYKNAGYIGVLLISLVYILSGLITISKTGKSVFEILATGLISMIIGILINSIFRSIGIRRGDEDEKMISTSNLHARAVEEILPYMDMLDSYCEIENKRAKRLLRARILLEGGISYDSVFDDEGALIYKKEEPKEKESKEEKRLRLKREEQRAKIIKRAVRVKMKSLTPTALTSDGGRGDNPFDFGKSKASYTKSQGAFDLIMRICMAVIFGYFGVTLASEVDLSKIIWNSLQIIMYVCSGIIQMYTSYMWIIDLYRGSVIRKIDQIEKFKLFVKNSSQIFVDN